MKVRKINVITNCVSEQQQVLVAIYARTSEASGISATTTQQSSVIAVKR